MNLAELQRKLIAAARANAPADTVPYAFEQRIIARLDGRPAVDVLGAWAHGLSRAAVFCVAVMLALAAWSYFLPTAAPDTLSQDVQTALFAAVDNTPAPADSNSSESQ
jgi:hypothetical protein